MRHDIVIRGARILTASRTTRGCRAALRNDLDRAGAIAGCDIGSRVLTTRQRPALSDRILPEVMRFGRARRAMVRGHAENADATGDLRDQVVRIGKSGPSHHATTTTHPCGPCLRSGAIVPGADAGIALSDPARNKPMRQADLHPVPDHTPPEGVEAPGWPRRIRQRGDTTTQGSARVPVPVGMILACKRPDVLRSEDPT